MTHRLVEKPLGLQNYNGHWKNDDDVERIFNSLLASGVDEPTARALADQKRKKETKREIREAVSALNLLSTFRFHYNAERFKQVDDRDPYAVFDTGQLKRTPLGALGMSLLTGYWYLANQSGDVLENLGLPKVPSIIAAGLIPLMCAGGGADLTYSKATAEKTALVQVSKPVEYNIEQHNRLFGKSDVEPFVEISYVPFGNIGARPKTKRITGDDNTLIYLTSLEPGSVITIPLNGENAKDVKVQMHRGKYKDLQITYDTDSSGYAKAGHIRVIFESKEKQYPFSYDDSATIIDEVGSYLRSIEGDDDQQMPPFGRDSLGKFLKELKEK